jgi:hypothetical protein
VYHSGGKPQWKAIIRTIIHKADRRSWSGVWAFSVRIRPAASMYPLPGFGPYHCSINVRFLIDIEAYPGISLR